MDRVEELKQKEENLIIQIEAEIRKILNSYPELFNNYSFSEAGKHPLKECLISTCSYSDCLIRRGINEPVEPNEDLLKTFDDSLQRELDCLSSDLNFLANKVNERKEKLSNLDRNIANMKGMMESQKNELTKVKPSMDNAMKNIRLRFRREKSDLKRIIQVIFPDNVAVQDLFARIIEHRFSEGSDKYLQLEETDDIAEQIELLRRTLLFEINPHDPLEIRLADLV